MTVFWLAWIAAVFIVLTFGAVLLVGAPYMPTLSKQRQEALDLLDLKPGETMYELGSGDGGLLIDAAKRGLNATGYELNPFLVLISRVRCLPYRKQVKIRWGNFWKSDLSRADGIFTFLLDRYMQRLDLKIRKEAKPGTVKLVSHAFKIPGKKIVKKNGAMFLYLYK